VDDSVRKKYVKGKIRSILLSNQRHPFNTRNFLSTFGIVRKSPPCYALLLLICFSFSLLHLHLSYYFTLLPFHVRFSLPMHLWIPATLDLCLNSTTSPAHLYPCYSVSLQFCIPATLHLCWNSTSLLLCIPAFLFPWNFVFCYSLMYHRESNLAVSSSPVINNNVQFFIGRIATVWKIKRFLALRWLRKCRVDRTFPVMWLGR
jgi:hypothetical protein